MISHRTIFSVADNDRAVDNPLLKEAEVAEYLGLSVRCLQGWRYLGGGPAFTKLGGAVRYRLSDILAFIEANKHKSTSDAGSR